MKLTYYLVCADVPLLFDFKHRAIEYAIENKCEEVVKVKLTKDCIIRLHNGGGGYIEAEEVVWRKFD